MREDENATNDARARGDERTAQESPDGTGVKAGASETDAPADVEENDSMSSVLSADPVAGVQGSDDGGED